MHGYYGSLKGWGPALIKSLTLVSNKRTYGPYGTEEGTYFSLPMIGGKIVGFHGKGGWYLDAIGVHLEPTRKHNPQNSVQFSQTAYSSTDNFGYSMIQGNLNKQYDVVIAVKQKDSNTNFLPNYFSKKNQFTITDYPTPKQTTDSRKSQFTFTDNPTPKQATDSRKNHLTVTDNPTPKQVTDTSYLAQIYRFLCTMADTSCSVMLCGVT